VVDRLDLLELEADPALLAAGEGDLGLRGGGGGSGGGDLVLGLLGRGGGPEDVVAGASQGSGADGVVDGVAATLGGLGGIAADLELLWRGWRVNWGLQWAPIGVCWARCSSPREEGRREEGGGTSSRA